MSDDRAKTPRTLLVADHLWEAFSTMAVEMGSERDALINQALYMFARLNGFLVPADLKKLGAPVPLNTPAEPGRALRVAPTPAAERPHASAERMAELAQKLASGGGARPALTPPPVITSQSPVEVDDSLLGEEGGATSMELPNLAAALAGIKQSSHPAPIVAAHPSNFDEGSITPGGRTLVLLADGRELDRVVKDRFLIGRGKHCDLIINSGK